MGVHCEGRVFARGGFSSVISAKGAAEQRATPLHGKHSAAPFAAAAQPFYLPETMNKPLYDTMAGLEEGEKTTLLG